MCICKGKIVCFKLSLGHIPVFYKHIKMRYIIISNLILGGLFTSIACTELGYCESAKLSCKGSWVRHNPGKLVKRWLDKVKNLPDCFILQNKEGAKLGRNPLGGGRPGGEGTEVWEGEEDVEGYFEGEGVLSVGDCTGQDGCMDNLERVEGVWFAGRLEGTAYFYLSEGVEMVNMVHGVKHGVGVLFWDTKKKDVVRMTLYRNGVEVGPVWDLTMGQGVGHKTLYQPRTASVVTTLTPLDVLGGGVLYNNSVWLHPDMETVMVGRWERGLMKEGREGKVTAVRCKHGIFEIDVEPEPKSEIFSYDPPTSSHMTSYPLNRVSQGIHVQGATEKNPNVFKINLSPYEVFTPSMPMQMVKFPVFHN